LPGVRRRTTRPREVASRKHEEKLRAANPQIKKAGAGARHAWCGSARRRFGSKHPRHSTMRRGREVAWSATENDAAAGEF
jgi:hypothetical protein